MLRTDVIAGLSVDAAAKDVIDPVVSIPDNLLLSTLVNRFEIPNSMLRYPFFVGRL